MNHVNESFTETITDCHIRRWGSSIIAVIPGAIAKRIPLCAGDKVTVIVQKRNHATRIESEPVATV